MFDRNQIEADWAARGFRCELWTDPPGQRWEDFRHETDEVVIVLEGEMEFEVEGIVSHPQPGEELLIPAGNLHSARNIGSSTSRWIFGYLRGNKSVDAVLNGTKKRRPGDGIPETPCKRPLE